MNKSFTVLTVSKRVGWESLARQSINRQTVKPDKWVVVREVDVATDQLSSNYNHINTETVKAPKRKQPSNLNASLNKGLKHIDTEYVIFYQDFIDLQPDCFEKLLALVDDDTFVTTCTPNYDGSNDIRYTGVNGPRACVPEEWETNVAIAPMKILKDIGGFDETYDRGWSWDNVSVACRAAMVGARFILDESNRPKLLPHEQTSKLAMELNSEWHSHRMKLMRKGVLSPRLGYI